MRTDEFDDELFDRILAVAEDDATVSTVSHKRPNWISSVERTGVWVETERSRDRKSGPQLVPAWMITVAWNHLQQNGTLASVYLLKQLKVHRSTFVCALLARFPDVEVRQNTPTILALADGPD